MESKTFGAAVFVEGLRSEWQALRRVLLRLPPWFRVSQFLLALAAEEQLTRLEQNQVRQFRHRNPKYRRETATVKAEAKAAEPFLLLWYEALDPADRLLLEEYAGLNVYAPGVSGREGPDASGLETPGASDADRVVDVKRAADGSGPCSR